MEPRDYLPNAPPDQLYSAAVVVDPVDPFMWLIIGSVAVLAWLTVAWIIHTPGWRGRSMGRDDQAIAANIINDAFDLAVEKKLMTAKRARRWKLEIGRKCDIADLQTVRTRMLKKVHPYRVTQKKEEIKHRLANGLYKDTETKKRKVSPIPGDPPAQILNKEDRKKVFKKLTAKA